MNRRAAILAILAMPLGKFDAWVSAAPSNGGVLTIDLGQWAGIRVTHKGHQVAITADDIFHALVDSTTI